MIWAFVVRYASERLTAMLQSLTQGIINKQMIEEQLLFHNQINF